jgi:sensor histidine kinase YesM
MPPDRMPKARWLCLTCSVKSKKKILANNQLYWLSQLGGWFIYWLVLSLVNIMLNSGENREDLWREQIGLTIFLVIGLLTTHFYRSFVKKRNWTALPVGQLIIRVIVSVFVLSFIILFSYTFSLRVFNIFTFENLKNELLLLRIFINVSVIISLWIATYFSVQYFRNYRKAQVQKLMQESLIKEATLNKLRSQLNPHFIFNSLNSIRALVSSDPEKARDSITALSNIFRKTLQLDKSTKVPFSEELQIVEDYLKLEKIRFEERLDFSFNIEENVFRYGVPPLMLQTLVENGIKHGISNLTKGGILKLEGKEQDGKAVFTITNSGNIVENNGKRKGYGLKNTRERLQLLYEGRASVKLEETDNDFVKTTLIIPKD